MLKGTFLADFNAFVNECMRADDGLNQMTLSAATAEKQIDRMTKEFSGENLITQAAAMIEAVERTGGAARLTEAEYQRVAAVAAQAAEKIRAMGEQVPETMERWAKTAKGAADATEDAGNQLILAGQDAVQSSSGFTTLAEAGKIADKTLGAFGVSLGPAINSIEEIGQVAGKTTADLGALGTGVAVAGAAVAGWNIGRWIADLTGADEKIASIASHLMGWGDLRGEEAGAAADALARASAIAGREITNMTEAIKINHEAVKGNAEQYNTAANRAAEWERELSKLGPRQASLRAEIESGNSTVAEMARHYNVSERAIDFLTRRMQEQEQATQKTAAAHEKAAREAQAHADAIQRLQDQMFGTDAIAKAQQYQAALGETGNLTRMTKDETAAMNVVLGEAIDAYTRAGKVAPQAMRDLYMATIQLPPIVNGLGSAFANVGTQVTITADTVVADMAKMTAASKAYDAETQAMVDAYVQMQYGAQGATGAIKDTSAATGQLVVHMQQLESQARSTFERLQAGKALMEAYNEAGVATGMQIATGGYTFAQQKKSLLPTMGATGPAPGAGQAWGNTLNVNVNNHTADDLANKLVTEMRHSGVKM